MSTHVRSATTTTSFYFLTIFSQMLILGCGGKPGGPPAASAKKAISPVEEYRRAKSLREEKKALSVPASLDPASAKVYRFTYAVSPFFTDDIAHSDWHADAEHINCELSDFFGKPDKVPRTTRFLICQSYSSPENENKERGLTDRELLEFAQLPYLGVLLLSSNRITAAGLEEFRRLAPNCVVRHFPTDIKYRTEYLTMSPPGDDKEWGIRVELASPCSDTQIDAIREFCEIQEVWAPTHQRWPPDDNAMTNESLRTLARLPLLEHIWIAGAKGITDDGLKHLVGHPALKSIYLEATSVTRKGISEFSQQMPQVLISISEKFVSYN